MYNINNDEIRNFEEIFGVELAVEVERVPVWAK